MVDPRMAVWAGVIVGPLRRLAEQLGDAAGLPVGERLAEQPWDATAVATPGLGEYPGRSSAARRAGGDPPASDTRVFADATTRSARATQQSSATADVTAGPPAQSIEARLPPDLRPARSAMSQAPRFGPGSDGEVRPFTVGHLPEPASPLAALATAPLSAPPAAPHALPRPIAVRRSPERVGRGRQVEPPSGPIPVTRKDATAGAAAVASRASKHPGTATSASPDTDHRRTAPGPAHAAGTAAPTSEQAPRAPASDEARSTAASTRREPRAFAPSSGEHPPPPHVRAASPHRLEFMAVNASEAPPHTSPSGSYERPRDAHVGLAVAGAHGSVAAHVVDGGGMSGPTHVGAEQPAHATHETGAATERIDLDALEASMTAVLLACARRHGVDV